MLCWGFAAPAEELGEVGAAGLLGTGCAEVCLQWEGGLVCHGMLSAQAAELYNLKLCSEHSKHEFEANLSWVQLCCQNYIFM